MSGLTRWSVTATVVLHCDAHRCDARWVSEVYEVRGLVRDEQRATPAFDAGWRVYAGARTQHTYCPQHGPTVPMGQVYPRPPPTDPKEA